MAKKRYAHVGIGGRARMYYEAISKTYNETAELVAFCDVNKTRMEYANSLLENELGYHKVPMYMAEDFEKMIEETGVKEVHRTMGQSEGHHGITTVYEYSYYMTYFEKGLYLGPS